MGDTYDYIIVGGGTAGVVIASRLSTYLPTSTILLLEAGPNAVDDPQVNDVTDSNNWLNMLSTGLVKNYSTTPQAYLNNREIPNCAGVMLSGSSGANVGVWHRPSVQDCDMLAEKSGNEIFRFRSFVEYVKRLETHFDESASKEWYGFEGPIRTVGGRKHPMREIVRETAENLGHGYRAGEDGVKGDMTGLTDFVQAFRATGEGTSTRQHSAKVYNLSGVSVLCESPVARILFDDNKRAIGVELISGTQYHASEEIIISCGAQRTPQLLMLSGIGPKDELDKHNIPIVHESLEVGKNYADHNAFVAYYKLKHPEKGYAQPFTGTMKPEYSQGMSVDFALFTHIPPSELTPYLQTDGIDTNDPHLPTSPSPTPPTNPSANERTLTAAHDLLRPSRTHFLNFIFYYPMLAPPHLYPSITAHPEAYIAMSVCNMQSISRGSVTLKSANPADGPVCNPNFMCHATDRFIMRRGVREIIKTMSTRPMKGEIEGEVPPLGAIQLAPESSDEEIDERIRQGAMTFSHPMGTCALGSVLDGGFRVRGVKGLRVCDASCFPGVVGVMPSLGVYVLGEICAEMVAGRV